MGMGSSTYLLCDCLGEPYAIHQILLVAWILHSRPLGLPVPELLSPRRLKRNSCCRALHGSCDSGYHPH